jgi:membrane-bound lytic murein transglycosylase MltF
MIARRAATRRALVWLAGLLFIHPGSLHAQRRPSPDRYDDIFRKYAKRYFGPGADWRAFKAQAMAESELNPNARSRVGARGLMQLMPSTFLAIQSKHVGLDAINDPEWNIAAGIAHDRDLWTMFRDPFPADSEHLAFMYGSYNAGEVAILRARRLALEQQLDNRNWSSIETVAPQVQRWRYRETLSYVRTIRQHRAVLDSLAAARRGIPSRTAKPER